MMMQRQTSETTLVGFTVGSLKYAVPIHVVREILNPTAITELPGCPKVIAGIIDHRGEVIPIIDLRQRFGLGSWLDAPKPKWVIVQVDGRSAGLAADTVCGVFRTDAALLRPSPKFGPAFDTPGIVGVTNHAGSLTFILDVTEFETLISVIDTQILGQLKGVS